MSKARTNALARIRRRNEVLKALGEDPIKIGKGVNTNTLKSIERTLDTKIKLSRQGIDTSNISRLTSRQRDSFNALGNALKSGNRTAIASSLTRVVRSNRSQLKRVSNKLNQVKGFGSIDFIERIIDRKKFNRKSKMLPKDANIIISALTNENYVSNILEKTVKGVNKALEMQGLNEISFDEFDINFTVDELNEIPNRTKKFLIPDSDPNSLDNIFDVLNTDEIDFSRPAS